jgi:hypothetical protein
MSITTFMTMNQKSKKGRTLLLKKITNFASHFSCFARPCDQYGQKLVTLWNKVQQHYNKNQPPTCVEKPTKSLETKWGVIKPNVSKFVGCHGSIIASNESETFEKDT